MFYFRVPRPFRDRDSQEEVWRQDHADSMLLADALLFLVCDAFSFHPKHRYKFAPTDRVMDIYRACYPRWQFWKITDSMELESLMLDLDKEFGMDDVRFLDLPLGEVVRMMAETVHRQEER